MLACIANVLVPMLITVFHSRYRSPTAAATPPHPQQALPEGASVVCYIVCVIYKRGVETISSYTAADA